MDKEQVRKLIEENPTVRALAEEREILWLNPKLASFETARGSLPLSMADADDAEARLARFAPFIMKKFPETAEARGIIESELREAAAMKERLNEKYGAKIEGRLFVKMDGDLPIAGSIKARGGIYEVLKHTEELALEHGLLRDGDSYEKLASDEARKFFSQYTTQVGSTGNLGLSIGIMSAAVGYNAVVHMSADARAWKKALLRSHGVKVIEYDTDYSEAVKQGRAQSDADPKSYFVDDENSKNLFLGYAVAAKRLVPQLKALGAAADAEHPLFVYLPCGVGGAPGGVTFGLKQIFGDAVHCFFIEPTQAPCMVLGMASGPAQRHSGQGHRADRPDPRRRPRGRARLGLRRPRHGAAALWRPHAARREALRIYARPARDGKRLHRAELLRGLRRSGASRTQRRMARIYRSARPRRKDEKRRPHSVGDGRAALCPKK